MLVRVPDYFDRFHCLAGACPHSCCVGWEVVVDEETGLPIWIDCTFRSYGKALPAPVEAGKRFFDGIGVTAEYRDGVFVLEDSGGLIYSVHVDRTFGRLCISPVGFGNAVSGAEASN